MALTEKIAPGQVVADVLGKARDVNREVGVAGAAPREDHTYHAPGNAQRREGAAQLGSQIAGQRDGIALHRQVYVAPGAATQNPVAHQATDEVRIDLAGGKE